MSSSFGNELTRKLSGLSTSLKSRSFSPNVRTRVSTEQHSSFEQEFNAMLSSPKFKKQFKQFLQDAHDEEYLLFLDELKIFRSLTNKDQRVQKANEIYNSFIHHSAPNALNLNGDTVDDVFAHLEINECEVTIFDATEKEVLRMMHQLYLFKKDAIVK
jgi:hypothetical protein